MNTQSITIIGLILNMVGTAILFFYGYPQPNHDEEVGISVSENTVFTDGTSVKSIKEKARKRRRLYKSMSLIGMGLVFVGFGVQLISVIRAT